MKIARVFPRKTKATPNDNLAFINVPPPLLTLQEIDEVHISVTFTEDIPQAHWLEKQWRAVGVPVKIGGAALGEPGGEFTPGMYLKNGYLITSRGCPNSCPHCSVPEREGRKIRELKIKEGFNILDDNLLRCSPNHMEKVFSMLSKQKEKPIFSGGLEAAALTKSIAEKLYQLNPERMFFAFDTPEGYEPLVHAGRLLMESGFSWRSHIMQCYVLIGYSGDTKVAAEERLIRTMRAGFLPYAMLYMDKNGERIDWGDFQREFCRPRIVGKKMKPIVETMGLI